MYNADADSHCRMCIVQFSQLLSSLSYSVSVFSYLKTMSNCVVSCKRRRNSHGDSLTGKLFQAVLYYVYVLKCGAHVATYMSLASVV